MLFGDVGGFYGGLMTIVGAIVGAINSYKSNDLLVSDLFKVNETKSESEEQL